MTDWEKEKLVEQIEVIINRHSPMENFEVKEICATEIAEIISREREEAYSQAIDDAIEAMPKLKRGKDYYKDTGNPVSMLAQGTVDGRNFYRTEALTALQKLKKEI